MAWALGNKRWTASFRSLNDTLCRIDIYKRDYTGSLIQDIQAADNPFFYEEDESADLLNDVLRYRTGYVRLVEEYDSGSTLAMTDIYPTSAFDRYVEVYYGSALVFNGYIQVQDFSNRMVPAPKIIEFPVISPLGLLDQKIFSNILPPTSMSLGELLNIAATDYEYVYFPDRMGYPDPVNMGMKISSLVVSPWNEDYHYTMNVSAYDKVMKGKSFAFLIESICKAFGWICHDTPDSLVFTCFDYNDTYCRYPVGHIGESGYSESVNIPSTAVALTDYYSNSDDAANIQTLLPDTGIEIEYEGDSGTRTLGFKHTYVPDNGALITVPSEVNDPDEINSLCSLIPIAFASEFSSSLIAQLSFNNNDKINIGQGCCAWNGMNGIMISMSGSYNTNHELFWVRFYIKKRLGQSYKLSYSMRGKLNGSIRALAFYESDVDDYYIVSSLDATNQDYVQATFTYRWTDPGFPQLPIYTLIFISDIKLDVYEDNEPYAEYRYIPATDSDLLPENYNPQPAVSSSINMPISLYRMNDHLIGSSPRRSKLTTYPYLFQPRKEYTGNFRLITAPTYPYICMFSYLNKNWRIIAQRFNPWDDEVKLTMQNSPILDNQ